MDSFGEIHDQAPTPEEIFVRTSVEAELASCIDALPADQAECVRLRFFADRTVEEAAHEMQRSRVALRALQHRAVRNLAQMLAGSEAA